jgi:hypothetical protein
MISLTLVAVLLFGIKSGGHLAIHEGTIMGTAFAASFGYWLSASGERMLRVACCVLRLYTDLSRPALLYGVAFVFNTTLSAAEALAATVCSA